MQTCIQTFEKKKLCWMGQTNGQININPLRKSISILINITRILLRAWKKKIHEYLSKLYWLSTCQLTSLIQFEIMPSFWYFICVLIVGKLSEKFTLHKRYVNIGTVTRRESPSLFIKKIFFNYCVCNGHFTLEAKKV